MTKFKQKGTLFFKMEYSFLSNGSQPFKVHGSFFRELSTPMNPFLEYCKMTSED